MARTVSRKQPPVEVDGHELRFPNERHLIEAIAALLTRLPWGISGVQVLNGPREAGKDIVFMQRGAFGELILCSCVVKNKKVTGSAEKRLGAPTILTQVRQSFSIPFAGEAGEKIPVQRVYVVTPYALSTEAKDSIENQLDGDIQFIGGSRLFDLFRTYWKDFLADEFQTRMTRTAGLLDRDESLHNIAAAYDTAPVDKAVRDVYVRPNLCRTFSEYRITEQFTSFLSLSTLRRKMVTNPLHRTNPDEPIRVEAVPRRWLLTITDLQERQVRFREVKLVLEVFRQLGLALATSAIEVKVEKFLDKLDTTRRRAVQKALADPSRTSGHSTGIEQVSAELDVNEHKSIVAEAELLASELRKIASSTQLRLNEITSEAATSTVSTRSFGHPAFVEAGRVDRAVAALPTDMVMRLKATRVDYPSDVLDSVKVLLITAPAGYGKTSFCRWHALLDIERYNNGESDILPVYVLLHKLGDTELRDVSSMFLSGSAHSLLLSAQRSSPSAGRSLRFYLDGLDEVSTASSRARIVELIGEAVKQQPQWRVILTARDYVVGPDLHWMPYVSVGEFSEPQTKELVSRWLSPEKAEEFSRQVDTAPGMTPLLRTPLLATLTLLVFRQTGSLPSSKLRLYETFLDFNDKWVGFGKGC